MKKVSTLEIRSAVIEAVNEALKTLDITATSKKTQKVIGNASGKITDEVKRVLKKQARKEEKVLAKAKKKNSKLSKKVKSVKKVAA